MPFREKLCAIVDCLEKEKTPAATATAYKFKKNMDLSVLMKPATSSHILLCLYV